jgi:diguanylate cyclase (GGDEF)-like protein
MAGENGARSGWENWGVPAGLLALTIMAFVAWGLNLLPCTGLAGAGFFALFPWHKQKGSADSKHGDQDVDPEPSDGQQKLLFDDFQAAKDVYVVKGIGDEQKVVPSSRTARPVHEGLRTHPLRDTVIPDFFDLDTDTPLREADARSEFQSLVRKVVLVLKDSFFAHTAAFFWINIERRQLVLESVATDSSAFTAERLLSLGDDLLSLVATTGKAQVLSIVNPVSETEILHYYQAAASVRSVVAVPVFFKAGANDIEPVGVLVADSKAEDAFGQETIDQLGRFTKLLSALIKSYNDKYDLLCDAELLGSIRRLQDDIKSDSSEHAVLASLIEQTGSLVAWEILTVTMFAEESGGWAVQKVVNRTGEPYVLPSQKVDSEGSIIGEVIVGNRVEMIPDLAVEQRVRFHAGEIAARNGSFVAIPISSYKRCYGVLTLENKVSGHFSGSEVGSLYRLVETAAAALEVGYMNTLVKEYLAVDHITGIMTKKYFTRKLEEEVRRAGDFSAELTYVCLTVDALDEQTKRYGRESNDFIFQEISAIIHGMIRPYDAFGKQDGQMLGVVLVSMPASEGYLWAEKLRTSVAGHVLAFGGRTFSVTISAGVAGLSEGMPLRELAAAAMLVHGKVLASGGNAVRVF